MVDNDLENANDMVTSVRVVKISNGVMIYALKHSDVQNSRENYKRAVLNVVWAAVVKIEQQIEDITSFYRAVVIILVWLMAL